MDVNAPSNNYIKYIDTIVNNQGRYYFISKKNGVNLQIYATGDILPMFNEEDMILLIPEIGGERGEAVIKVFTCINDNENEHESIGIVELTTLMAAILQSEWAYVNLKP